MPTYVPILDAEVAPESPGTTSLFTRLRDNALAYAGAPSGTRALWQQTAAPLGWTKDTAHNDKALRIVSGEVSSGGSSPFSTVFSKTATDEYTLQVADIPAHPHPGTTNVQTQNLEHTHTDGANVTVQSGTGIEVIGVVGANHVTGGINSSLNHEHPFTTDNTGGGGGHRHGMDIRVAFVDTIIAVKD